MSLAPTAFETSRDVALFEGVRSRRAMAFLFDATMITILTFLASVVVFFLGVVTLGLGWALYGIVFPAVALLYNGLTIGGEAAATPGMRLAGLEMRMLDDGAKPGFLLAVLHALVFWFLTFVLLNLLVLVVSLFNERKRLLHDILVGTVVVRREPVARAGL